jgi:RNA polymerase sigma factor (sigma-70 family)
MPRRELIVASGPLNQYLQQLRRVLHRPACRAMPDGDLLARFVEHRDEAAFEVLVWRYGPMVLSLGYRLLGNGHDAEDVLQATFLAFARKAGTIGRQEAVGGWLYRVAFRVALRARSRASKRRTEELNLQNLAVNDPDTANQALRLVLDEAIQELPEKERNVIILYYLQGKTSAEVAAELGCPLGTVTSRLSRARERLRRLAANRGVPLSAGLFATTLAQSGVLAEVPAAIVGPIVKGGVVYALGNLPHASLISAKVFTLAEGALRAMAITNLKVGAAMLVGGMALVAALATYPVIAGHEPDHAAKLQFVGQAPDVREAPRSQEEAPAGGMPGMPGLPGVQVQSVGHAPEVQEAPGSQEKAPDDAAPKSGEPLADDPRIIEVIKEAGGQMAFYEGAMSKCVMTVTFDEKKGSDERLNLVKELKRVRCVNMRGRGFTNAGVKLLMNVKTLRTVGFLNCAIDDMGLAELKACSSLERLYLNFLPASGDGLKELKGLPLKDLWVDCYPGTSSFNDHGMQQLKNFPTLRTVHILNAAISDVGMESLSGLLNLRDLMLASHKITDRGLVSLKPLAKGKLQHLQIDSTSVTDDGLDHLKGLTELRTLVLGQTQIDDNGLTRLSGMTHLADLGLYNSRVTDAGLAQLKSLSGTLRTLSLGGTKVTDAGLKEINAFRNLWGLYLDNTNITDAGLEHLKEMPSLERIHLTDTRVTDAGVAALRKALPKLHVER